MILSSDGSVLAHGNEGTFNIDYTDIQISGGGMHNAIAIDFHIDSQISVFFCSEAVPFCLHITISIAQVFIRNCTL